jgi:DNA gyrase subunit A
MALQFFPSFVFFKPILQIKNFYSPFHQKKKQNILINIKMKNEKTKKEVENYGKIISTDLHSEMSRSYMEYAMSVIYGRALPDVRDGMKPVHRRILFALDELGLNPNTPFRKCARVVGEVLGKYHPHGDTAVYDALVRMAQNFSMRSVLISGHGNFGSIDNDPAAAMRYTECRMSKLSKEVILKDIKKKTTDFINNFDGSCYEPSVLPSVLPTILLNGSNGIAVGMATNIPPHNLTEIVRAAFKLIENYELNENDLIKIIPAPDFPTGGSIIGLEGCSQLYKKGQGTIIIRGNTYFEKAVTGGKQDNNKISIIITELPFQVNKTNLITKIAELVNNKTIEGIIDLRDESDRDGIRVVIELRKDANKNVVLNNLFKKTPLQSSMGSHMLALVGNQPVTLTLKELLLLFIQFRKKTIRRKIQFELNESIEKNHLIKGLILTLNSLEFILTVIYRSKNNNEAKAILIESGLTNNQSNAILEIQLRRLTKLESKKLKQDFQILQQNVIKLKKPLALEIQLESLIKKEMKNAAKKFGMPRRTQIIYSKTNGNIEEIEMIENIQTIVIVTNFFIKRMIIETFESQSRGTRGKKGIIIEKNDQLMHFFSCNNHDTIICISRKGIGYSFKGYQIPISHRKARGISLSMFLGNVIGEKISSIIPISDFSFDESLILLTKNGMIKKTPLLPFRQITSRGLIVLKMKENDDLCWARKCYNNESILVSTKKGKSLRFMADENQLPSSGRNSKGKKAMSIEKGDKIIDFDILPADQEGTKNFILLITAHGIGKRISSKEIKIQSRGGKGIKIINWRKNIADDLVSVRFCSEKELFLSTKNGTIVRQKIEAIAIQSRLAKGVKVQNLIDGDLVAKISLVS